MAWKQRPRLLSRKRAGCWKNFARNSRTEAVKAIQSAISASKEVIARQAMKELSEAHEAGARNNYALWMKKIEQDMESARQHMLAKSRK